MRKLASTFAITALLINPFSVGILSSGSALSEGGQAYVIGFQCSLALLSALLFLGSWKPDTKILNLSIQNITVAYASLLFALYLFAGMEIGLVLLNRWLGTQATAADTLATEAFESEAFRESRARRDKSFSSPHLTMNALGFRAPPFEPKKTNEKRLVFLGGSTALGYNVADSHTIPALIEKRFHDKGVSIRAFNLGLNGENIWLQVPTLEKYLDRIAPDIIVVFNGSNEFGGPPQTLSDGPVGDKPTRQQDFTASLQSKLQKFHIFQFAFALLGALTSQNEFDPAVARRFDPFINAYAATHRRLNEICSQMETNSCLTVVQPRVLNKNIKTLFEDIYYNMRIYLSLYEHYYNYFIDKISNQISIDRNVNVIDLRNAFDGFKEGVFIDYVHVNCTGNDIIAEQIFNYLESMPSSISRRPDSAVTPPEGRPGRNC